MVKRARVAALLGAGSSADAGLPVTLKMTEEIIERTHHMAQKRLLQYILHRLAADAVRPRQRSTRFEDQRRSVAIDVERLFAAVELLIEREDQPWSPFVSAWDADLESFGASDPFSHLDAVRRLESALDERYLPRSSMVLRSRIGDAFESAVQDAIRRARPNVTRLLEDVRQEMLANLRAILAINDSSRVEYLLPLVELARSQKFLTVATLNYDLSVELAASRASLVCETGIDTWLLDGRLDWRGDGVKLLKLHGSIDWLSHRTQSHGELPHVRFTTVADEGAHGEPAVIFGEGSKLRAEGPFLELLLAWSADLNDADNLLVVGYSFRDPHVNETIARWFNAEGRRAVILVNPEDIDELSGDNSFLRSLTRTSPVPAGSGEPTRFRYVQGRARDVLVDAVEEATRMTPAT